MCISNGGFVDIFTVYCTVQDDDTTKEKWPLLLSSVILAVLPMGRGLFRASWEYDVCNFFKVIIYIDVINKALIVNQREISFLK